MRLIFAVGILAFFACTGFGCAKAPLGVPAIHGPITLDGELGEPDWLDGKAITGAFLETHGRELARPYSEAHFLHDDRFLYVGLYAADQDLRATVTAHDAPLTGDDFFAVRLQSGAGPVYEIDISVAGVVRDFVEKDGAPDTRWESGIALAVDTDGTINAPSDDDEEWVVEASIPLRSLGVLSRRGTRFRAEVSRCDRPRDGIPRCGKWSGTLELK